MVCCGRTRDPEILKSIWAGKYAFAEDKLREIGNLLGFGETACCSPEQPEGGTVTYTKSLPFIRFRKNCRRIASSLKVRRS